MSEWKEYKLGNLVYTNTKSIDLKYPYKEIEYLDTGSIFQGKVASFQTVKTKEAPSRARRLVDKDDIIYSTVRPIQKHYGYIDTVLPNLVISTGFVTITCCDKNQLYPKFLYYYLTSDDIVEYLDVIAEASTSAYPSLKPSDIENLDISLPPLPEQQAIASILSSLDDKIDLLQRQNTTLEKMAETLFRQWFVVEAKGNSTKGKLGDLIGETVGGEWGKEYNQGEFSKAVRCIRGTDIADLNNGLAGKTPIRFIKDSKFRNIEPKSGDLILEISGGTENQSTGRVTYINNDVKGLFDYPIIFSNFCRLLRIKDERYSYFLCCYLRYLYEQNEFFNLENGSSGIKNLDYKSLLYEQNYSMPVDRGKIIDFYTQVKIYFQKINQNKNQIRTLTALRDTLLPKLMSGEVRVKNICSHENKEN